MTLPARTSEVREKVRSVSGSKIMAAGKVRKAREEGEVKSLRSATKWEDKLS